MHSNGSRSCRFCSSARVLPASSLGGSRTHRPRTTAGRGDSARRCARLRRRRSAGERRRCVVPKTERLHQVQVYGTAARGDERDRREAVMRAPGRQVAVEVDGGAIGKRLRVEIGQLRPRCASDRRRNTMPATPRDRLATANSARRLQQDRQQLLERLLAFANDDDVGAGVRDTRRRSAADRARRRRPARRPLARSAIIRSAWRLVIRLTAMPTTAGARAAGSARSRRACWNVLSKTPTSTPRAFEMRREIEQAERRVRPHDALLFRILGEKVAVGEQEIHHDTCCGGRTSSTSVFSTGKPYQSRSQRQRDAARSGQRQRARLPRVPRVELEALDLPPACRR